MSSSSEEEEEINFHSPFRKKKRKKDVPSQNKI
jgi:hypothetical protein